MPRFKKKKKKVFGTTQRPRLSVFKGGSNIHTQIIDDTKGITLAAASTVDEKLKKKIKNGGNVEAAKAVGEEIAIRAKAKGIKRIVFDRGQSLYHGRVKALAEGARASGLEF